jgi:hypothetical protein
MRMVAGCLVAFALVVAFDQVAHGGRYWSGVSKMFGHMTSVSWKH